LTAAPAADGAFTVALPKELAAGIYAVTATIRAERAGKSEDDLLSAQLDLHDAAKDGAKSRTHQREWAYAGLGAALVAILGAWAWIRMRATRARRSGGLS
jgi:hypothetical protein